MKNTIGLVIVVLALAFTGCMRVPFTQAFKNTIVKSDSLAVEKIQYYIGKTIVLERTTNTPIDTVTVGKVGFDNGIYKQVVHIRKGTSAICQNINTLRQKAIVGPGPNEDLIFVNNGASYMLNAFNKKIMYAGLEFKVVKGADAPLMVSKKTTEPKKTITRAKGMKLVVDEAPPTDTPADGKTPTDKAPAEKKPAKKAAADDE